MSKKTTFEVEDDLDRDPLDTNFEEEKPTTSAMQQGETAKIYSKERVKECSQVSTGGATENEEKKRRRRKKLYNAAREREASAKVTWRG